MCSRSWVACRSPSSRFSSGARQAGRNAERVERMRRTVEVQRDQLDLNGRVPGVRQFFFRVGVEIDDAVFVVHLAVRARLLLLWGDRG